MKYTPSILAANWMNLEQEIKRIENDRCDGIHIDIMDGHFVPNLSFGPELVKQIRGRTKLPLDVHLMVEQPDLWFERFTVAGANLITFHMETSLGNTTEWVQRIRRNGAKAGIAFKPGTQVIGGLDVDVLLMMSVEPGFGGQEFLECTLKKIRDARHLGYQEIQVDGGITDSTAKLCEEAGATWLVAGTSYFKRERA